MFSRSRLDSPPPSQYHRPRPWSPDTSTSLRQEDNAAGHGTDLYGNSLGPQRREASDVSVEALDLADYAQTLHNKQSDGPYPPFPRRSLDHFPSASHIPAARDSRDTLSPPSLISRGPTLSSTATSRSNQRPFSLPSHKSSQQRVSFYHPQPRIADSQSHIPSEIDISQFPAWSRSWYRSTHRINPHSSPPIDDLYTTIPPSNLDPYKKQNVFDPGYVHHDQDYYPETDPSSLSDPLFAPHSSLAHESTRELLPWSHGDSSVVDPLTKEERIRMLEREFGQNSKKVKGKGLGDFTDEDGKPLVGTVDARGYLVTQGSKKRTAVRVLQTLFALGAGIPAIYAAIVIKPNPPPPPAGKPQAFVLYIISSITFLLLFYLFFLRPCCCGPRRKNGSAMDNPLSGGMMVLPIPNAAGDKKKNKRKNPKKGGGGLMGGDGGDVQVNLIVDPHVFSGGHDDDDDDDDDSADDTDGGGIPGGYYGAERNTPNARKKRKNKRNRRRSVFAGLAMEEKWKRARGWAKKIAFVDGAGVLVWGAVFIFVIIGQRCPAGGFDGWCNAYNISTACACLLCIAFMVSVFFDVKDLYASRTSPRTRI